MPTQMPLPLVILAAALSACALPAADAEPMDLPLAEEQQPLTKASGARGETAVSMSYNHSCAVKIR